MEQETELTIELQMCLEKERETCLKKIQSFYKKYGNEKVENLQTYLHALCESLTDPVEIDEIKKELELLEKYN